jgi:hypothetical protein
VSAPDQVDPLRHSEAVLEESSNLLGIAVERGILLRLTGSLAVRHHCDGHRHLLAQLGRRPYRDIDLLGYSKQKREIGRLFESSGYVLDPAIRQAQEFGIKRFVFEHPSTHMKVDIFMDELAMAHTVPFLGRLELDEPTITATDLLLTKVQIHEITENDLIDCVVLIADHDFGTGRESIDRDYVVDMMRKDWGFCFTTQQNLEKIGLALDRYTAVPDEVAGLVRRRVGALRDAIEASPKTSRWKLRARVGTRVKWYEQVEEVNR